MSSQSATSQPPASKPPSSSSSSSQAPTSLPPSEASGSSLPASSQPDIRHPRGRLAPPLPKEAPVWQRVARAARRLGHGLALHDALQTAPAMAFHFFLSLLPLLVFVGYVVGSIARKRGVNTVLSPVLDKLPEAAELVVKSEIDRLAGADTLGPIAAVGFLWIASGGTHGLMHAMETVVGAPRRPWWKKRVLSLAWVIGTLGLFALVSFALIQWDRVVHPAEPLTAIVTTEMPEATAATSTATHAPPARDKAVLKTPSPSSIDGNGVASPRARATDAAVTSGGAASKTTRQERAARRRKIIRSGGERLLGLAFSVLVATAVLAGFYRFSVTHSKRVARRVLPGALVAVVVWFVISSVFGLYVKSLAEYAVFYGSLTAVAVLLVWLWLTSLAILVGAELNAQLEGLRD